MPNAHEQDAQLNIPAFLLNPIASRVEERGTRPTKAPVAEPDEATVAEPDTAVPEKEPARTSQEDRAGEPTKEQLDANLPGASAEKQPEGRTRKRRSKPEPGSVRVLKPEPEQEPEPEQDVPAEAEADVAQEVAQADAAQEVAQADVDQTEAQDEEVTSEPEETEAEGSPTEGDEPEESVSARTEPEATDAAAANTEAAEPEAAEPTENVPEEDAPEATETTPEAVELEPATPEASKAITPSREDEVDAMMQSVLQAVHGSWKNAGKAEEPTVDEADEADETDEPDDAPSILAHALALASVPQIEEEDIEPERDETPAEPEPHEQAEPEAVAFSTPEPEPTPISEVQPEAPAEDNGPVPTLEEDLETMRRIERRLFAHRYASTELDAFGSSIDPRKATADRSEALSVLAEEDHELLSAPGVGEAIDRLCRRANELEPLVATQAKVLAMDRWRIVSAPAELRSEFVRLTAESYDVWVRARREDDWQSFAPYLDRLVGIRKEMALAQNPNAHPYDTLLDEYEPGTNRAFYNSFFARVKHSVVPLLSAISMSNRNIRRSCVEGHFDERRQWDLAEDICEIMGIDESAHYLTSTVHPYSSAMTSNYVVTASHIVGDDLMSNVYTMLHELGHNLYEQGVDPKFNRTSLKGGTSSGMHEAQSRLFENLVGRDRAFMGPLLELMRHRYPGQLGRVTPNQLYGAVNLVTPSLIRVNADEVSYPLHILVRYEIERLLFDGEATARDVPKLWADLYERYIGIRPTNDADGALQDVHWAMGDFGYFPAYALGNAYAAQLRAKMLEEGMNWNALLREGNLEPIRAWLKEHIWQYGRSKKPRQLIQEACGEPFSPRHYANYLTEKFTALYGLGRG